MRSTCGCEVEYSFKTPKRTGGPHWLPTQGRQRSLVMDKTLSVDLYGYPALIWAYKACMGKLAVLNTVFVYIFFLWDFFYCCVEIVTQTCTEFLGSYMCVQMFSCRLCILLSHSLFISCLYFASHLCYSYCYYFKTNTRYNSIHVHPPLHFVFLIFVF